MRFSKKRKYKFFDWGKPIVRIANWGAPRNWPRKKQVRFKHALLIVATSGFIVILFVIFVLGLELIRGTISGFFQNVVLTGLNSGRSSPAAPVAPQQVPKPVPVSSSTFSIPMVSSTSVVTSTVQSPPQSAPVSPSPAIDPSWLSIDFYVGFGGVGWIDASSTSMYRDNSETAYLFPPKYSWQASTASEFNSPGELNSTGITTKVVQDGGLYKVLVYAPGGSTILSATSTPIVSPYEGKVGLGGTSNDLLVVLGGYQGAAARITDVNGKWSVQDLSSLFQIRAMNGGFDPAVIEAGGGGSGQDFYVYSLTPGNPKLIKLYSDSSGNIVGAVDFTPLLFPSSVRSATFAELNSPGEFNSKALVAKMTDQSGSVSYWRFTDNGFDISSPVTVVSSNVNTYPWSVALANLKSASVSGDGTAKFYLSNDGQDWQPVETGGYLNFPPGNENKLFWRVVFEPPASSFTSPFFRGIEVDYWARRPD